MTFGFSADGHIVEPEDLLTEGLPPSLRRHGVWAEARDGYLYRYAGDKMTSKMPLNRTKMTGWDGVRKIQATFPLPSGERIRRLGSLSA